MNDFLTASAIAATALNGIGISDPGDAGDATSPQFQQAVQQYFSKMNGTTANSTEKPFVPIAPKVMLSSISNLPRL